MTFYQDLPKVAKYEYDRNFYFASFLLKYIYNTK